MALNILNIISELRTIDIVILIFVIFIFIFLIILSSTLLKKNKELRIELKNKNNLSTKTLFKEEETKEELLIKKESKEELLKEKINNIIKEDILNEAKENPFEDDTISIEQEEEINEILKDIPETAESGPYTKNVLKNLYASGQTSPVNIGKNSVDVPKIKVTSYVKESNFNQKENKEKITNKKEMNNQEFIENISKRMEEELHPQTIELTDYEKRQEEEAIISYQELLKVKDRLYKITDDEEIDTFIDELKEFRTDLEE